MPQIVETDFVVDKLLQFYRWFWIVWNPFFYLSLVALTC